METRFRTVWGLGLDDLLAMPFDRLRLHLLDLPRVAEPGEIDEALELAFAAVPYFENPEVT